MSHFSSRSTKWNKLQALPSSGARGVGGGCHDDSMHHTSCPCCSTATGVRAACRCYAAQTPGPGCLLVSYTLALTHQRGQPTGGTVGKLTEGCSPGTGRVVKKHLGLPGKIKS